MTLESLRECSGLINRSHCVQIQVSHLHSPMTRLGRPRLIDALSPACSCRALPRFGRLLLWPLLWAMRTSFSPGPRVPHLILLEPHGEMRQVLSIHRPLDLEFSQMQMESPRLWGRWTCQRVSAASCRGSLPELVGRGRSHHRWKKAVVYRLVRPFRQLELIGQAMEFLRHLLVEGWYPKPKIGCSAGFQSDP